jgi:hypothetical protein
MQNEHGFNIRFLAHYEPTNKIWGWMTVDGGSDARHAYAFWSVVGKTISFKRHTVHGYSIRGYGKGWMSSIESAKLENKYVEISLEDLLSMWPDFMESLGYRFTYLQLSNGFEA